MPRTLTVTVRTKHYAAAPKYMDIDSCPLAQALKEKFPDKGIVVGGVEVSVSNKDYAIPQSWLPTDKDWGKWQDLINERIAKAKAGIKQTPVKVALTEIFD